MAPIFFTGLATTRLASDIEQLTNLGWKIPESCIARKSANYFDKQVSQ